MRGVDGDVRRRPAPRPGATHLREGNLNATLSSASAAAAWESRRFLRGGEIWQAMSVSERLEQVRSADGPLSNGSLRPTTRETEDLIRWRGMRALDGGPLPDPTSIYGCTESELLAVLAAPSEEVDLAGQLAWADSLNNSWSLGRRLLALQTVGLPTIDRRRFPFVLVAGPWIAAAVHAVRAAADEAALRQDDEVPFTVDSILESLLPLLAARLEDLCRRTCILELHAARLSGTLRGPTPHARFDAFIEHL
jgi:hypothetical protein